MLDLGQKFLTAKTRMNTDRSSKAYIAQIHAQNIIASVANGTPGGSGFQGALALGKINSVIDEPSIPPPTDLSYSVLNSVGYGYRFRLTWTNMASDIIETLIETNIGSGWTEYIRAPAVTAVITVMSVPVQLRLSSVTPSGTSVPLNPITLHV